MALPAKFSERVLRDLGEAEGAALCAALDTEPPVSVRLNPAKGGVAAEPGSAQGQSGPDAPAALAVLRNADGRVPWCGEGYYLAARPQFTLDSDFHAGAYYVQEAASQFVGYLLGGVETAGKRILDLCAAPGGKTTLYASLAGPDGLVVANEIDRRRAQVLADNVRKWGTGNIAVTACEPRLLGDFEAWFDVVAVDAPCSGEGMFRKDMQARGEWSENNVKVCAARQDAILREAWRALKPGGKLLYSTCTFNRDEDEGALERMLAWAGAELAEAEDITVDRAWGIACGRVGVFRTYRFYPHRARGEGFFAAVARKAFDAGGRSRTPRARRTVFAAVDKASAAELRRWVRSPGRMCFAAVSDTCYGYYAAQAEAVKTLAEALPVIYAGVAMGQVFKGRLRPDPALAFFCGLEREAVPVAELGGDEALCYLRKQEVSAEAFAEGMNLVCARGQALGFAKRIGNRVNNMYPNSLRIIKR
ncbi:methyltransferase RsmF C-terminal domain-like protein [Alistipes sp.]|uniref:methyltransferase RsmF C-terminal domain-like protein n=1 Tax=Alistipes sp. TaxID=1872444 RepID=UPI003AF7C2F6